MSTRQARADVEDVVSAAQAETGESIETFEVFALGNLPDIADEVVAPVFSGRKRATAVLLEPYEAGSASCRMARAARPPRSTRAR